MIVFFFLIKRLVLELDVLCKVGTAAAVLGFGQLVRFCGNVRETSEKSNLSVRRW